MLDYIQTLRSMIGHTGIIIPGARALFFNDASEILLEQQRLFDDTMEDFRRHEHNFIAK